MLSLNSTPEEFRGKTVYDKKNLRTICFVPKQRMGTAVQAITSVKLKCYSVVCYFTLFV